MNPYILDIDYTVSNENTQSHITWPEHDANNDHGSPINEDEWQLIDKRVKEHMPPKTVNRGGPGAVFGTWLGDRAADNELSTEVEEIDESFLDTYC